MLWSSSRLIVALRKWGIAAFVLLAFCRMSWAQLPSATVLGVVHDSSGAVVPAATVSARNMDTGLTRTTISAADGSYRLPALPVGNYEVSAEHEGFQKSIRGGLTLTVSQEAVINFSLDVGAVEQTVEVSEEAPLVNTTSGSLGGLMTEEKVAELPLNGRNFISLILLQPGVTQQSNNQPGSTSSAGIWFSSNGAPVRSNNYLLDGAIMTNATSITVAANDGNSPGIEGLREFRVVTNAFSAEYGMTMGSQVLLVSKSGGNDFHGSLFEYLRNSALDARNFFDYKSPVNNRRLPAFTRNQFGASGGGRIKKDKTFFFAAYEGLRQRLGLTIIDTVPAAGCHGAAGAVITSAACPQIAPVASVTIVPVVAPLLKLYPLPNLTSTSFTFPATQQIRDDYGQIRIDHSIASSNSLFGRYTITDSGETDPQPYPQFATLRASRSQYATLSDSQIFSPSLLDTARFSFSRTFPAATSRNDVTGPEYSFVPGKQIGNISIGGIQSPLGPSSSANPAGQKQNIFSFSDDFFYTRGRNSWKFGALYNHYQGYFISSTNNPGSVTFSNLSNFLLGVPTNYSALTPGSKWDRTYHHNTLGFYVQNDIRVLSNLTLNLGLRYEFQTVPQEQHGYQSALRNLQSDAAATIGPMYQNMSLRNFSPRFGFAWDVTGDGKTAIRGGVAELYDVGNLGQAIQNEIAGTPPFASNSTVSNATSLVLPLFFPASAIGKSLRTIDYRVQQPHLLSYNLTVERQLGWGTALTLAYAGSRGMNLIQTVEGNPIPPQILADGRPFWPAGAPRVNLNWASIELKTGAADSWYNALQVGLAKRLGKGLQFQSSYTWSKLIDDTQGQVPGDSNFSSIFGTYPGHLKADRGPADFDLTQNWKFHLIYQTPDVSKNPLVVFFTNAWRLSSVLALQSGLPLSPAVGSNISRSGVNGGAAGVDRPNLNAGRNASNIISGTTAGCPGVPAGQKLGTPMLYFDPCAFSLQAAGFLGTAGRNLLRGPGIANLDFSIAKDFGLKHLNESSRLEFRAEAFNILNRANFWEPNRTVFAGTGTAVALSNAGLITSTITPSRQIQFALKFLF